MNDAPFGNCKTAELHRGNHVQSFGGLIAIDKRTQRICACSANIDEFVAKAPAELLGENWSIAFRPNQLPSLFKPADAPGQQFSGTTG